MVTRHTPPLNFFGKLRNFRIPKRAERIFPMPEKRTGGPGFVLPGLNSDLAGICVQSVNSIARNRCGTMGFVQIAKYQAAMNCKMGKYGILIGIKTLKSSEKFQF